MTFNNAVLTAVLLTLASAGSALASDDRGDSRSETSAESRTETRTQARSELGVTMRIIENPEALGPEAVTRVITLPPPLPPVENDGGATPPVNGVEVAEHARESGREFGAEVAERARDMSESASERREDFGRSRAEEARPEMPARPRPPGP